MAGQTASNNSPVGAAGQPGNTDPANAGRGRPFPTTRGKGVVKGRPEAIERRMAALKKKGK